MSKIFISYRREDSELYVGRLYCYLLNYFKKEDLFFDFDSIRPGDDFKARIRVALDECTALVAVIGEKWLRITDEYGRRRLDDPDDVLRCEISSALRDQKFVLPILVGHAVMPQESELPLDLRRLSHINALHIDNSSFDLSIQRIVHTLTQSIAIENIQHKSEAAVQMLLYQLYQFTDTQLAANRLNKLEGVQLLRVRIHIAGVFWQDGHLLAPLLTLLGFMSCWLSFMITASYSGQLALISGIVLLVGLIWSSLMLNAIFAASWIQVTEGGLTHYDDGSMSVGQVRLRVLNQRSTTVGMSSSSMKFKAYYIEKRFLWTAFNLLLSIEPINVD